MSGVKIGADLDPTQRGFRHCDKELWPLVQGTKFGAD
jgi:hypothetical protein